MSEQEAAEQPDILLVEDNAGDVRLTREAFAESSVPSTLHVASDGVEALDFLHRRNGNADAPRPAIILLDLNLPRKSGDEVLTEIRNDDSLRRIPVIILTSSDVQDDIDRSYELGANAYLRKPVDPNEFITLVGSIEEFWLSLASLPDER